MKKSFILLLFFAFGFVSLQAQFADDQELIERPQDTIPAKIERGILQTFKVIFSGRPGKVALYGILIPGGGQLYNKRYWKAPIVWAADAGAITWYIYNRNQYVGYQNAYEQFLAGTLSQYKGLSSASGLRIARNEFLLDTERAGITVVVLHLVSMIEAFTDAHLMDFDISEDLTFEVKNYNAPVFGQVSGIGLSYTF